MAPLGAVKLISCDVPSARMKAQLPWLLSISTLVAAPSPPKTVIVALPPTLMVWVPLVPA